MRIQGRLTEWNDARGFGFITPLAGGPKYFVHVSEFPTDVRRPVLNDLVTFETAPDGTRVKAVNVLHLTPVRAQTPTRSIHIGSHGSFSRPKSPQLIPFLIAALVIAVALGIPAMFSGHGDDGGASSATSQSAYGDSTIQSAFVNQESGIQVEGRGTVDRVLPDDTNGSRHQRFILRLASGQTLLVAHNIDIAPRVEPLNVGATISFSGVYEWNAEGGVIHWTHHDPDGQHVAGWLESNGLRYQ